MPFMIDEVASVVKHYCVKVIAAFGLKEVAGSVMRVIAAGGLK
jgi:hypothetical protein